MHTWYRLELLPCSCCSLLMLQGVYTCANGDVYRGNWERDEKNGTGHQTFANSTSGQRDGGAASGQEWYEGHWKDGRIEGKGE